MNKRLGPYRKAPLQQLKLARFPLSRFAALVRGSFATVLATSVASWILALLVGLSAHEWLGSC